MMFDFSITKNNIQTSDYQVFMKNLCFPYK